MALVNLAALNHTETPNPAPNIILPGGIGGSRGRAALAVVWVYLALKSNEFEMWSYVWQSRQGRKTRRTILIHLKELDHRYIMYDESVIVDLKTAQIFRNESDVETRIPEKTTSAHVSMNYVIFEREVNTAMLRWIHQRIRPRPL